MPSIKMVSFHMPNSKVPPPNIKNNLFFYKITDLKQTTILIPTVTIIYLQYLCGDSI